MNAFENATLADNELLEVLEERKASILSADTTQLGRLFTYSFHAYSCLQHDFRDAPFGQQLYTDQKHFLSFTYPQNRHLAKHPEGAGKAPDLLHMYLRSLGMRISGPFVPAARKLIGDEAKIRITGNRDPTKREKVVLKDRPPNDESRRVLEDTKEFEISLKDQSGETHVLRMPNERTKVHHHVNSYNLLESALALREQSILLNGGRSRETFGWVRDIVSLQSVETMVQIQEILKRQITEQIPEKTLEDFNLSVPLHDRLCYARAVFERSHEARRDHALHQIQTTSDDEARRLKPTALSLESVGESPEGFEIESVRDAAAVLFMMPTAFHLLQYALSPTGRADIVLPPEMDAAFKSLSENVFNESSIAYAALHIRSRIDLLRETARRNEAILAALKHHPHINPHFGIQKACALLHSMLDKVLWLPESIMT